MSRVRRFTQRKLRTRGIYPVHDLINNEDTEFSKKNNWYYRQDNERQYQNDSEMQRYERAMERRQGENDQAWNDRQWLENQKHDQIVQQIEFDVLLAF